jgi:TonB family protein
MRTLPVCGFVLCAALLQAQTTPEALATGDTQPGIIVRNDPEYSTEATRAFVQSTVLLNITVGEDGKAHDIKVAQPSGFGLDEKAVEAMQTWVFRPGTKDGHPVPMPANVEMNFHLQVRNDTEDHSNQFARLNFTLPTGATRPELITGKLPGNPNTASDQALRFHIQVGIDGVPANITVLGSTDKAWEQKALRVVRAWRFRPASLAGLAIPAYGVFELAHSSPPEPEPTVAKPMIVEQDESDRAPRRPAAPIEIPGLIARSGHTATLLKNGTVLLAGGSASSSAQTFDPITRTIATTGSMLTPRDHHTATLLKDGTVLITGGQSGGHSLTSAEIFDPSTGKFASTASMHEARSSHAAALLPDGRVLICGGSTDDTAEIYDPRSKTFLSAGHMIAAMPSAQSVTLRDGSIFLLGSTGTPAEIFHPDSGTFTATEAQHFAGPAALLNDGTVLIFGTDGVETFNPLTNTFHEDAPTPGTPVACVLLASGKVLVTGTPTELYDPASQSFTPGPVLKEPQSGATATLLGNGNVLVAGAAAELLILN